MGTNDSENSQKAEEVLKQSAEQRRYSTEPSQQSDPDPDQQSLADAIADAYAALEDGDQHENLTVRDRDLAALVAGLEETGELESVAARANDVLDRDAPAESRAHLLKAVLRVGFEEVAPEAIDDAKDGKRQHLTQQADEF